VLHIYIYIYIYDISSLRVKFHREGKFKKKTRDFKVNTEVNIRITMLRLVTPCSLIQGTKVSEASSAFNFKIS